MLYATLKTLHLLAIVVWVGGMVFAHVFLRPAVASLDPPARLTLMHAVLGRFFAAVLGVVVVVLLTGLAMIGLAHAGGRGDMPWTWTVMTVLGLAMMAIFGHIRFALHRRLGRSVAAKDWPAGAAALARIRTWVGVNLALGVAIVVVTGLA